METFSDKQTQKFDVIIVGCSIAGLTLANALSKRKINYVVLESQKNLPPPLTGNALTLLPNGVRILSQLGLLEDLKAASQSITSHSTWLASGHLLKTVDMIQLPSTRHGYDAVVIARWDLIQILYNSLVGDRRRVVFDKRAVQFDQSSSEVKVKCADGSSFAGDVVVGADGIHSATRREALWQEDLARGLSCIQKVPLRLSSEYSGIYGISDPIPELHPGQAHRTYGNGFSFIVNVGKYGRIYWLLSIRSKETHQYPRVSRYAQDQASIDEQVRPFLDTHISSTILFKDLYYNTKACVHVGLEELLCENWVSGNIVCIGDSVHKMTPNLAQGANCAIESAASLANRLVCIIDKRQGRVCSDNCGREAILQSWEASRKHRMRFFYTCSWILARCESFCGTFFKGLGLYIGSYHGEQVISYISDIDGQTEYLDFLPEPPRVSKPVLRVKHGSLFLLNYLFVKMAFALLDSSLRFWQFCFP
ncbi:hypothetical protein BDV27DRAFT_149365 [Aspergillus caelatus]|uniref:FAD-binding domain-containing protein n=1 Tax=Aspergillus caelatus TaxID=61420 RepID=A0A5N6ZPZ5_9EURO|nr:uncharacterized protein BDV27DRAFT_149365 [Aspergillus caelatus]KAE8359677.1 hypothetical protein BDV27DRAFT_149365 [Aspergillus caelatus]